MKPELLWTGLAFLLVLVLLLVFQQDRELDEPSKPTPIKTSLDLKLPLLSEAGYELIAAGIFQNETASQIDKLTYWGTGEDFPSMGIGHFIWFPKAVDAPFDEQFPAMVSYVAESSGGSLPAPDWLLQLEPFDAPWDSKQQFDADWSSPELTELREWLYASRQYQARFIVSAFQQRWQSLELADGQKNQFNLLLQELMETPEGLFAVIDYYNFKGLGNNPRERYEEQGWGLVQVLQAMTRMPGLDVLCVDRIRQFRDAAVDRLSLRVELSPPERNEARWLPGWLKRLDAYVSNESTARRVSGCGFRVRPYLQNPTEEAITFSWLGNHKHPGQLKIWKQAEDSAETVVSFESNPLQAEALAYHPAEDCQQVYCVDAGLPYLHQVRVTELQPGGSYRYQVIQGDDMASGHFSTPTVDTETLRFIVYADSETEPESTGKHSRWPGIDPSTLKRRYLLDQTTGYAQNLKVIAARKPAFVAIAGDLVQSGGEQRDWDEFWRHNDTLAANSVIFPALGNHEYFGGPGKLGHYEKEDSERSVRKYQTYFDLPANGASKPAQAERYYAVRYGPISLIVLDTTDGLPHQSEEDTNWYLRGENDGGDAPDWHPGSEQYSWLESQLELARQSSAFTFVMFHAAPYTSGVHGKAPGENSHEDKLSGLPIQILTPLFMRYGVAAVFNGHDEMYEHSVLSGSEVDSAGNTHNHEIHFLDVGIGGDGLRGPVSTVSNPYRVFLAHADSAETYDQHGVLIDGGKHYGHLEVNLEKNSTGLWQAQMDAVYIFPVMDSEGRLLEFDRRLYKDSFKLIERKLE
jgi:hypothetical protein